MNIAGHLASLVTVVTGGSLPVRLRAWDGSEAGPDDGPLLIVEGTGALRRLLWQPNELGLAQAYAAGEISVDGDLAEALRRVRGYACTRRARVSVWHRIRALAIAARLGALGRRPLARRVQPDGRLSTEFYALLLGETMASSCAYWTGEEPGYGLADAQRDKLDLICGKLSVEPGTRLLDVGCGWGPLTFHAAQRYGARVVAVTRSDRQHAYVSALVIARDLSHLVQVRRGGYRDIADGPYDAIATVEAREHLGAAYPAVAARLRDLLRPGGRLLIQQMSRGPGAAGFTESFIAFDRLMQPVGETVAVLEQAGLEVRDVHAMREHYVLTTRAWLSTLEGRWAEAVALAGEPVARIWRLYLAGGALAFAEGRTGVDQILAVRPADSGLSGMPLDRDVLAPWREPL